MEIIETDDISNDESNAFRIIINAYETLRKVYQAACIQSDFEKKKKV